ncbi:MAG: septal ring lytic transglycosylase RlpA family protein [Candidatus Parcubacteria bacterium]|nr:septal ring lytic transglycosylase RlpA family protein [Candidatus Parcubacteria bacterium]
MSEGVASWYKYKSCNCAASPDYPKGTKLKVTNVDNGKSIIVKVNDWGPDRSVHPNRVIDLDVVAFKQIAKKSAGLCKVKVELAEPVTAALK